MVFGRCPVIFVNDQNQRWLLFSTEFSVLYRKEDGGHHGRQRSRERDHVCVGERKVAKEKGKTTVVAQGGLEQFLGGQRALTIGNVQGIINSMAATLKDAFGR